MRANLNVAHAIKPGASIRGMCPEMAIANLIIYSQYAILGYDCIITSGTDGEHSTGSRHYSGQALDYRTRHMRDDLKTVIARNVKEALGDDFDVVLEPTHLHVEFHPKKPLNK